MLSLRELFIQMHFLNALQRLLVDVFLVKITMINKIYILINLGEPVKRTSNLKVKVLVGRHPITITFVLQY